MHKARANEKKMIERIKQEAEFSDLLDLTGKHDYGYSCYDASSKVALFELKHRENHTYDDYLVERKKLNSIIPFLHGKILYYCCSSYNDPRIHMYDIKRLNDSENFSFDWRWEDHPDGTHLYSKGKSKVKKEVCYLPKSAAHIILER